MNVALAFLKQCETIDLNAFLEDDRIFLNCNSVLEYFKYLTAW